MATIRVQHAFQSRTGSSKDLFVNTFHFIHSAPVPEGELGDLALAIKAFYEEQAAGASHPLVYYMGNMALGPGRSIKMYDIAGPPPHAPIYTEVQFAEVGNNGTMQLPEESAICLSYEGLHLTGLKQARRRGRIYIGPLNISAMTNVATTEVAIQPGFAVDVTAAAAALFGAALAAGFTWVIHSVVNEGDVTLARVWCDNSFDTVRGRGHFSSARIIQEGPPFDVP